jgi:hypothetical protein
MRRRSCLLLNNMKELNYYYRKYAKPVAIYNLLRKIDKYNGIGDYPLLAMICEYGASLGYKFSRESIHQALKETHDKEFRNIPINHTLVDQLYAFNY